MFMFPGRRAVQCFLYNLTWARSFARATHDCACVYGEASMMVGLYFKSSRQRSTYPIQPSDYLLGVVS